MHSATLRRDQAAARRYELVASLKRNREEFEDQLFFIQRHYHTICIAYRIQPIKKNANAHHWD